VAFFMSNNTPQYDAATGTVADCITLAVAA